MKIKNYKNLVTKGPKLYTINFEKRRKEKIDNLKYIYISKFNISNFPYKFRDFPVFEGRISGI